MSQDTTLATRNGRTDVATVASDETLRHLNRYTAGYTETPDYIDALATISAGYRGPSQGDRPGLPQRSEDGTIYVHGDPARVPNLIALLQERNNKGLTITFPSDTQRDFVKEVFLRYSATRLEAFGDAEQITTIAMERPEGKEGKEVPVRRTYTRAEQPGDYARIVGTCKAYKRIYFYVMVWENGVPQVDLSDGVAPYALRTTSEITLRNLESAIRQTKALTRGRIAGIPFELAINPKFETAGPDGMKRRVPVFTFTTKSPQGIRLTAPVWRTLAQAGLEQADLLMLPEPQTWEAAEAELAYEMAEPTDEEMRLLAEGGRCDADLWRNRWFATAAGTRWESDEERGALLQDFTRRLDSWNRPVVASLAEFLGHATESQANALILYLTDAIAAERIPANAVKYDELMSADADPFEARARREAPERVVIDQEPAEAAAEEPPADPHTPKYPNGIHECVTCGGPIEKEVITKGPRRGEIVREAGQVLDDGINRWRKEICASCQEGADAIERAQQSQAAAPATEGLPF